MSTTGAGRGSTTGDGRLGASDCERIRTGRLAQPVNAVTSGAFCVAGWMVVARRWGNADDRRGEVAGYALLLNLVGAGSVAFHGPQLRGSKLLHDWPIPALMSVVAVTPLVRRRRGRPASPGWTSGRGARLAATGALAGAAYVAGRTGSPVCDPDSSLQAHGVWHLVSAAAFAQVAEILYGEPA